MSAPSEVTQIVSYVGTEGCCRGSGRGIGKAVLTGMFNGDQVLAGEGEKVAEMNGGDSECEYI